jgi:hypothetical protein
MTILPGPVVKHILKQMETVAHNEQEQVFRRATAAFEYGLLAISLYKGNQGNETRIPRAKEALALLYKAALFDHSCAKRIVAKLHEAFGVPFPGNTGLELAWLEESARNGSRLALQKPQVEFSGLYRRIIRTASMSNSGTGAQSWEIKHENLQICMQYLDSILDN